MPAGVSAQGLPVSGIRLPGDGLADPEFQGCEALAPCRERARGEPLQFLAGKRPRFRVSLVVVQVRDRVPLMADRHLARHTPGLACRQHR
jgi:hypothetical protein